MTSNDLELPIKKGFLVNFFSNFWMQRTFQEWIATKCLKIDQDNLRMKFSALNADFSSPKLSADVRKGLRTRAYKRGTPLKSGYFTDIALSSMKTVAQTSCST